MLGCQGDGRPFWRIVVAEATGCMDSDYFEEVYQVPPCSRSFVQCGFVSSGACMMWLMDELFLFVSTMQMETHGVCLLELTEHCMI